MESYLDKSLNRVYKRAGVVRDQPLTWKCTFPVFSDLIQVWEDDRKLHKEEDGESALALIRKTYPLGKDGSLSYMNRQTDIDLSKGFTVIDLVKVPEIIRPAMNVLVTGMLATYFKVDSGKGTTIAVDEGGAFLREKQLANMVLNILTQGRSYDIGMIFATQQFADLEKAKLSEEFMTNTPVKIVLGSELDKKSISYIKDFLMLDDTAVKDLKLSGKGQGIIKIGDTHAPITFIPSEEEMKIIKGFYTGTPSALTTEHQTQAADGRIKDKFLALAKENYIIFNEWIEGEDQNYNLQMLGYRLFQPQNIITRGNVNCWIHEGIIKENGLVKNQSLDHYSTVMQLAGILIQMGFEKVAVNHSDDVDVSATLSGETYGFEYEHPDSHDRPEIRGKKQRGLLKFKHLLFIGSKANEIQLKEAAGPDFVKRRGSQLKVWLDEQLSSHLAVIPSETEIINTEKDSLRLDYKLTEITKALPSELQKSELKISEDLTIEAL